MASYFFYGFWDWRFLGLIVFSTLLDFTCGRVIHRSKSDSERKLWLWLSVAGNLGVLGFFKYFNFFGENLSMLLAAAGFEAPPFVLTVVLPVGISFYPGFPFWPWHGHRIHPRCAEYHVFSR